MSFYLHHRQTDADTHVVGVSGELDLHAAPDLKETIEPLLAAEGTTRLIIDLSDATFVDSTGISVLISALKRLRASGGSLELICANDNVLRVFEFVGLEEHIPIHRQRAETGVLA